MSEISKFDAYKKKLQGICDENNLIYSFSGKYPPTLTFRPLTGLDNQIDMLESGEENYRSPDASLVFACKDGEISWKTSETFTISEALFSKLKNLFKNALFLPTVLLPRRDGKGAYRKRTDAGNRRERRWCR